MKPYWLFLFSVIFLISGCSKNSVPDISDTTDKPLSSTDGNQTSDPSESSSFPSVPGPDDIRCPAIMETVFPTDDIVMADYIVTNTPYSADSSGKKDSSDAIQRALDDCAKAGGVVYLPAGTYSLSEPVSVPAGVELRGASSVPTRDQSGKALGTVIFCRYGVGDGYNASTPVLITLTGKNAGLSGIRIVCVENSPADRKSTGYLIRGEAEGVYCVNCSLVASDYGIDFRSCDKAYIKKLIACCYKESISLGGKGGVIEGCLQNGTVLCRCSSRGLTNWVKEDKIFDLIFPITRSECTFIRLKDAENTVIYNTFAYGVKHLIETDHASGVSIVNVGADNLGDALLTVNAGSVSAVNVMRWNGSSYVNNGGKLRLFNRITSHDKYEENTEE